MIAITTVISAAVIAIVALIAAPLVAARADLRPEGRAEAPAGDGVYIGFSMDSFVEERRARDRDAFVATAKELGASVNVQIGDEDPKIQEAQILFLLESGVDVLVVIPSDPAGLERAVAEADRRGVPILAYDRLIQSANVDLFLAFDAERAGELQAEAFLAARRAGSVVLYNGRASDPNSAAMRTGILNALAPAIERGDVSIVADYQAAERRSEEAYALVEALIDEGAEFDAILAVDDMAAEAIIRALSVRRLAGSVFVAGADADLAACQRIAEGTQSMTVYKPIDQIAATAAELAVYLARGDRVTVHNAIWDGSFRVPFYELEPVSVTAEALMGTIVKDGFHLEEDVYRNVLKRDLD
jgi:D-xylose transport system substrate-binding protein